MKKLLLMAAVLLASVGAYAQHAVGSFTLQPRVGLNVANFTDNDDADPRVGFAGGVEGEYQVSDIFSVSAGVLYSMQGSKYSESGSDVTAKFDYVNVPIMANVYVVKGLAVKLGIQPGFNVNNEYTVKAGGHSISVDGGESGLPEAKTVDFSIPVGLSYEFPTVPIVIDARYNWGLTKVVDGGDSKNSVFQFTLGYKFDL
ncbi:porin family protein [uncultured Prevotella sp.]|uniref:porin family protein n=1 Tax=uncultured Prevotella sp. TaxID=159272 RepID=UPI00258A3C65|nr:porin family protein [uncultured Prevotella sp.]